MPRPPQRSIAFVVATSLLVAAGCATGRPASEPIASVSASAVACERPLVQVQNLTQEPVALYKGGGRRQSFVAEVAPGGVFQQPADLRAGYFARAGRGRGTRVLNENSLEMATGQVRVEYLCANRST